MTRKTGLIIYGVVLFILTTAVVIMIPMAVQHPLDFEQKLIVFMLGLLGYAGTASVAYTLWLESPKNNGL